MQSPRQACHADTKLPHCPIAQLAAHFEDPAVFTARPDLFNRHIHYLRHPPGHLLNIHPLRFKTILTVKAAEDGERIEPGTVYNDIISQEDWMPTLVAAAGMPGIVEKCKQGHTANGKQWKVHLDGYNFLPYFKGDVKEGPREEIFYFGQGGELNAIRWTDWKLSFATLHGNMATAVREVPAWPEIVNLRADPYEKAPEESGMYLRWMIDNMWLFVPVADKATTFLKSIPDYPFQVGANFNLANVSYRTFMEQKVLQQLQQLEAVSPQ